MYICIYIYIYIYICVCVCVCVCVCMYVCVYYHLQRNRKANTKGNQRHGMLQSRVRGLTLGVNPVSCCVAFRRDAVTCRSSTVSVFVESSLV